MYSSVLLPLASIYPGSCTDRTRAGAQELNTAAFAFDFIFAIAYAALSILCIAAVAIARDYRRAFVPLLISLVCSFVQNVAMIIRQFSNTCNELRPDVDEGVVVGGAIATFFHYWSLPLLFVSFCLLFILRSDRALRHSNNQKDSGSQKAGLGSLWSNGTLTIFSFLMLFGTTTSALYTRYLRLKRSDYADGESDLFEAEVASVADRFGGSVYTFDVFWFASTFFLGGLAFSANKIVRNSGLEVKVLKTFLYVACPLFALRVLTDFIFTILLSPSGLVPASDNLKAVEGAYLAELLLTNTFHTAAATVLIACGCRRSNWMEGVEQGGQQAGYPFQVVYPPQSTYAALPAYTFPTQQTIYPPDAAAYPVLAQDRPNPPAAQAAQPGQIQQTQSPPGQAY